MKISFIVTSGDQIALSRYVGKEGLDGGRLGLQVQVVGWDTIEREGRKKTIDSMINSLIEINH